LRKSWVPLAHKILQVGGSVFHGAIVDLQYLAALLIIGNVNEVRMITAAEWSAADLGELR